MFYSRFLTLGCTRLAEKKLNIFHHLTYQDWLQSVAIEAQGRRGHHKAMAEAAGCQPSFLSQVFRGKVHLTPDQAAGLAEFWAFGDEETEYFLALVHYERSGSKAYRRLLKTKIESLREANSQVGKRIQHRGTVKAELQARYYSDWTWALIHIMTSVDAFQDPKQIAHALHIEVGQVLGILKELKGMELVQQVGASWKIGANRLHLERGSAFHATNQRNFRHYMLGRLTRDNPDDLHYCAAYGLSAKAYRSIRERLLELIAAANQEVLDSTEEQVACITLDLVSL